MWPSVQLEKDYYLFFKLVMDYTIWLYIHKLE